MPTSPSAGFSPWLKPTRPRANPDEETADWRAVCGRTARTVRRAGRALALPDPYQDHIEARDRRSGHCTGRCRCREAQGCARAAIATWMCRCREAQGKDCSYNPFAFPPSLEVRCARTAIAQGRAGAAKHRDVQERPWPRIFQSARVNGGFASKLVPT